MKFLCPSCKAKYQIGDEKVAGRSVRMKCRKCGYVIQVSSVPGLGDALPGSESPPADPSSDASAAVFPQDALTPSFESSPPAPAVGTPRPAPAAKSAPTAASTPAAKSAPTAASTPAAKSAPTAASAPSTASAPAAVQRPEVKKIPVVGTRPAVPKPAFTAAAPKAPVAAPKAPPPRSSIQKPTAQPASAALGAAPDKRVIQSAAGTPLPVAPAKPAVIADKPAARAASPIVEEEEERTRIADVGALAGAFSLAVGGTSDTAGPDSLSMPADEWFVGINGVPVGPIRLSELRSKAASGSVNRESLVWRDGFEDWRPLGTFPELLAIVDESVSSARASLTPFTPSAGMIVGPVPGTSPAAVPAVSSPDTEAYASSGNGVTGSAVVTDEFEAAGVPKRSGTSPAAWIAVAIALMFGLTIGFVLFNKGNKTVEVVKYVDRVVPGAASGAVAAPDTSVAVSDPNTPADPKNPIKRAPTTVKSSSNAAAEPDKANKPLTDLQRLSQNGPSRAPDSSSGPSGTVAGTGQLDGTQIQSTVARYTGSVKRACWQPALDTRDKDAPTTARVNVAITVQPSGSVSNAVVNGDPKGYRGLSQCISSRVRGWQFPPSSDTTTVNVPFVFAAQ